MALNQTLVSTRNFLFVSIPENPSASTQITSVFLSRAKKSCFSNLKLKCSVDYRDNMYSQVTYPKPAEIPWTKELTNTVHLIGVVGTTVEIKHLPSGKVLAWTRLAVKKSSTDTSWINLTFWDELAQIAFQHVEKGQQIYVTGRLVSDTVESDEGKQQTYYKVVVQQLNFVEKTSSPVAAYDHESNFMAPGRKMNKYSGSSTGTTEELWQAFFANPVEWWDNRNNKRNPKYPDFKHKDTGEALWVEGKYNPPWVKSQLAILDKRMGSFRDDNSKMQLNFMSADEVLPF